MTCGQALPVVWRVPMEAARQLLKQFLDQEKSKGVTHLRVDRVLLEQLRTGKSTSGRGEATANVVERATPGPSAPAAAAAQSLSKGERLDRLRAEAEKGGEARKLGTLRDVMVFATGNAEADIMFIGEAPGAEEEKLREPFVGPAGQLLTKIIQAMGLRRSDVYISNICKYRPMIGDGVQQGTRNRPPTLDEMQACLSYVVREIEIIQPKIIVALGATASTGLGIEGSVASLRGTAREFRGIPVIVTYHPSYLLRREQEDGGGLREKRMVWEDMLRVMEHVGLPISAKQRGYFSKAAR